MRWIVIGVLLFVLLGAARFTFGKLNAPTDVETWCAYVRPGLLGGGDQLVILNATGYIIAAHKIELAAKVVGKVPGLASIRATR